MVQRARRGRLRLVRGVLCLERSRSDGETRALARALDATKVLRGASENYPSDLDAWGFSLTDVFYFFVFSAFFRFVVCFLSFFLFLFFAWFFVAYTYPIS